MSNVLVDSQEYLETIRPHQLEQLSIFPSRPSHLGNGPDIVPGTLSLQALRHTLVKQNAHGTPMLAWRLPKPAALDHELPLENRRGTHQGFHQPRDSQAGSAQEPACRQRPACRPESRDQNERGVQILALMAPSNIILWLSLPVFGSLLAGLLDSLSTSPCNVKFTNVLKVSVKTTVLHDQQLAHAPNLFENCIGHGLPPSLNMNLIALLYFAI